LTPDRGEALDGFLRWNVKRLVGIVNGIDTAAWDPATDPRLPAQYSRAELVPELARLRARLVVLGSGEPALEQRFRWLADVFREHVAIHIGFDGDLAHRIYAGA